jgi:sugar phosphate isomerase/epimerase
MQFLMFTKHLQELPIAQAGEVVKELGFDGVDLTVRPGGHVVPEHVEHDLPEAVRVLRSLGLVTGFITTAITGPEDPYAEAIFRTAAEQGIRFLKLGYWRYEGFGSLRRQIAETREKLRYIQKLARTYGVRACIHSHSGPYLSAVAPVVAMLLEGFDPDALGAYVDPGHMTVEGGGAGWKIGLDLLSDRISLVAVKSFGWFREPDKSGRMIWRHKLVPLEEGTVRWDEVFACLRQAGFDGYVSLHSEYQGPGSWRDLSLSELIEQTRRDLAYIKRVVAGSM